MFAVSIDYLNEFKESIQFVKWDQVGFMCPALGTITSSFGSAAF
jgi:hypothetical protein